MFSSLIFSLLVLRISSSPVRTCGEQQECLSMFEAYEQTEDRLTLCLYFGGSDTCSKDSTDAISYACYDQSEENKIEGFAEGLSNAMCITRDCEDVRDLPADQRYVEFGVKDGRGCSDANEQELDGFTDECRPATEGDVFCGGGQNRECIHRIFYSCPSPPTTTEGGGGSGGGGIPTCDDQNPCLTFTVEYNDCDAEDDNCEQVVVTVLYKADDEECTKDPEAISHVCWADEAIYDIDGEASGGDPEGNNKIEDFPAGGSVTLTGECNYIEGENFVEIGFKDAQGCDHGGDGENVVQVRFDNEGNNVECSWDPDRNICGGGGNTEQCVWKIYYDYTLCMGSAGAMLNEKQTSNNVFGIKNVSDGMNMGIWSAIIVIGLLVLIVVAGLVYYIGCKVKNNKTKNIEKQMQMVTQTQTQTPSNEVETPNTPNTPQSPKSAEIETEPIEIVTNVNQQ